MSLLGVRLAEVDDEKSASTSSVSVGAVTVRRPVRLAVEAIPEGETAEPRPVAPWRTARWNASSVL
jgi:hypothetical protein